MANKRGTLSINSDNIFPIIKKWLYSDHDIFFREMISNGCDAITKLKKLEVMGEYTFPEGHKNKIEVIVNPEEKTLKFIDTGLGMTADEVEEYITQIAFSGATEFLEKYKDKTNEDQIIGHFGLGFYSAFMVADEVHIDTLSYKEDAVPVHWECEDRPLRRQAGAVHRYTGNVTAARNMRSVRETVPKSVQRSPCSSMRTLWSLPMNTVQGKSLKNTVPSCLLKFSCQKPTQSRNMRPSTRLI